jgi:hypothetical protein
VNLALACRICDLRKSDHINAVDSLTQTVAPLFNPGLAYPMGIANNANWGSGEVVRGI